MTTLYLAATTLGVIGALGAAMWFLGRFSAERKAGAQQARDEITQEAYEAKKREAADMAAPARSKSELLGRMRDKAK